MKSVYGAAKWETQAIAALSDRPLLKGGAWDTTALLGVTIGAINVMKTATSKSHCSKSDRSVVERKGSALFINGNRILDPAGKPSVKHSRLRAAVHKVAAKR